MATSWQGRRVAIAGGLGFIGSNLAETLVGLGARVTILDSLIPDGGGSLRNVKHFADRIHIELVDLRDSKQVAGLLEDQSVVYMLTAQTGHAASMTNPCLDLELNCRAQLSLLEVLRRQNSPARVIYTSTRQVYGRTDQLPVKETHPCIPSDINGVHKLATENYLRLYRDNYQLPYVILRLTNTYGPRMNLGRGTGVASVFIKNALGGKPIRLFGTGNQKRDFNFVSDVVDALIQVADSSNTIGKTFNLGYPIAHSLLEFVEVLSDLCHAKVEYVPFPPEAQAIDIGDYQGDYAELRACTGWEPQVGLAEGLRRTLDYFASESAR